MTDKTNSINLLKKVRKNVKDDLTQILHFDPSDIGDGNLSSYYDIQFLKDNDKFITVFNLNTEAIPTKYDFFKSLFFKNN